MLQLAPRMKEIKALPRPPPQLGLADPCMARRVTSFAKHQEGTVWAQAAACKVHLGMNGEAVSAHMAKSVRYHSTQRPSSHSL